MVSFINFIFLGQNIVYRDLKPENVLLDAAGNIRIIDFGFSKQLQRSNQRCVTNCGTPGYLAPEVMLSGGANTSGYDAKKSDIWSIGILICQMVGGYIPFTLAITSEGAYKQNKD